ncbi:VOC family protein [Microbulbifer taiwanensis]|uniref:VOC family protein n=1 Tax=Microbulbifer taiwanensis TaxID=986746 RepID=A0ABW1YJZ2_9GAMM|nr:VOC family protein [Microbulbifer taiwanensis]
MARTVTPFLMFEGAAEEAMNFYLSLFVDSEILSIDRYGRSEPGAEGSVRLAEFRLGGQRFKCIDSPLGHEFSFTPSFSIYVDCEDVVELERAFAKLAEGGEVLMPLDNYGFSEKFGWTNDRFGVSWQLNLT